jgi:hypothetical protein
VIVTKWDGLRDDILCLARSLGFAAYSRKAIKGIKSTGFKGEYNVITISGDISRIPVKVARKQANPRRQVKNVLRTGFVVEDIGVGEYFGFELDGDSRFLLEDFTITHNSKTAKALGGAWFSGSPISISNKDGQQMMSFCWIVELAELASLRASETESQKQFLTVDHDIYRPPYGSAPEKFPRFAVCLGTTNDEEYLADATGNRRYWPVKIRECDVLRLIADRDQLWAEAAYRYLNSDQNPEFAHPECPGERWWFATEAEEDMARGVVASRRPENTWATAIREFIGMRCASGGGKRLWGTNEIAQQALDIEVEKLTGPKYKLVTTAIREAGLLPAKGDGGRPAWRVPDSLVESMIGRENAVSAPSVN